MPDAAVVVVAYRSHEWLVPCLESVVEQCTQLIVVDNGSDQGAVGDIARDYATEVVRLERNVGFAGGVNAGIVRADSELVGVLNDDAFAEPGWLDSAVETLADESYAAVGPKVLVARPYVQLLLSDTSRRIGDDPRSFGRCIKTATAGGVDVFERLAGSGIYPTEHATGNEGPRKWRWTVGDEAPVFLSLGGDIERDNLLINGEPVGTKPIEFELVNSAGLFITQRGFGGDIGFLAPDMGQFDEPADRFAVSGAALVTTKRVLRHLGRFAAHYFAYYEDLDWAWRAQLAGFRIRYDPSVSVRHVGGVTSGGPDSEKVQQLAARNRMLTLARNAPVSVLAAEVRDLVRSPATPGGHRGLGFRLPAALLGERRTLARRWERSPAHVWAEWAGVNES